MIERRIKEERNIPSIMYGVIRNSITIHLSEKEYNRVYSLKNTIASSNDVKTIQWYTMFNIIGDEIERNISNLEVIIVKHKQRRMIPFNIPTIHVLFYEDDWNRLNNIRKGLCKVYEKRIFWYQFLMIGCDLLEMSI